MRLFFKLYILLTISSSFLFSECTSQQKAQMIMNNISQKKIDKICSNTQKKEPQKQSNLNANTKNNFYITVSVTRYQGVNMYETYYDFEKKNVNDKLDLDTSGYDLSLGYILNNNSRIEISKTKSIISETKENYEYNSESTLNSVDLNYIWIYNTSSINPYILVGLGLNTLDSQLLKDLYGPDYTIRGSGLNSGIGFNYSVSDSLETGVGLNIKYTLFQEQLINYAYHDVSYTDKINLSTYLVGLSASLRLKF